MDQKDQILVGKREQSREKLIKWFEFFKVDTKQAMEKKHCIRCNLRFSDRQWRGSSDQIHKIWIKYETAVMLRWQPITD